MHDVAAILRTQQVNPEKLTRIIRTSGYDNPHQRAQEIVALGSYTSEQLKDYKEIG